MEWKPRERLIFHLHRFIVGIDNAMTVTGGIVGFVSMGVAFAAADTWEGARWGLIGVFIGGVMIIYGSGRDKIEIMERIKKADVRATLADLLLSLEDRRDAIAAIAADEYQQSLVNGRDAVTDELLNGIVDGVSRFYGKADALLFISTTGLILRQAPQDHPWPEAEAIRLKSVDTLEHYAGQLRALIARNY